MGTERWTMMDQAKAYLDSLDPPAPVRARLEQLMGHYRGLGARADRIFVSETLDDEGAREFQSLWLVSEAGIMEAEVREDESAEIDGVRLARALTRWAIRVRDFDFATSKPESRMSLDLWFSGEIVGQLQASGGNCLELAAVVRDYVVPLTNAK
jgi:hypothetical protein